MNNVMVDLETLGTGSDAVIIALGAVAFGDGVAPADTAFYAVVDPQSCVDAGLKMDVSTVMWWMKQSDAARSAITRPGEPLDFVLARFAEWIKPYGPVQVWGNGATFDNVILANAFNKVALPRPWRYTADRCYRTMRALLPAVEVPPVGTSHNALDDAIYQATYLVAAAKAANISL